MVAWNLLLQNLLQITVSDMVQEHTGSDWIRKFNMFIQSMQEELIEAVSNRPILALI